jgi:hypothetical protein
VFGRHQRRLRLSITGFAIKKFKRCYQFEARPLNKACANQCQVDTATELASASDPVRHIIDTSLAEDPLHLNKSVRSYKRAGEQTKSGRRMDG